MTIADDIAIIKNQEQALVLPALDEAIAFTLGSAIRERARREGLVLVVDVSMWDRQLFFAATAGTSADNTDWVRRKINTVRRFSRASYRMLLERGPDMVFAPNVGVDNLEYALAGGGFPLRLANAGIIGSLTVSGLPGRDDHRVVVDALCDLLGHDKNALALPPQ